MEPDPVPEDWGGGGDGAGGDGGGGGGGDEGGGGALLVAGAASWDEVGDGDVGSGVLDGVLDGVSDGIGIEGVTAGGAATVCSTPFVSALT